MKSVKVILIAAEIASLYGVIFLAFTTIGAEEEEFFRAIFISLFAVLAVTLQKEQQEIKWED